MRYQLQATERASHQTNSLDVILYICLTVSSGNRTYRNREKAQNVDDNNKTLWHAHS
ncbi:hypothetical protein Hanom_Chr08g00686381 [Helianthus anomalus]